MFNKSFDDRSNRYHSDRLYNTLNNRNANNKQFAAITLKNININLDECTSSNLSNCNYRLICLRELEDGYQVN